ncbi:MAG: HAD family hydrolase [Acidobacteria bacterium]|nr:HAD family hydrolase [Acidobacteriota bacterium]
MTDGRLLIFDMDGVLVDVTESYRQTICETVKLFTGSGISNVEIQALKNRGGSNNDWDLTLEIVESRGVHPTKQEVIDAFQQIYLGVNCDGLISRERWLVRNGLFDSLARRYGFAMFTGRERWEAEFTLGKFAPGVLFDPIIGMEDVKLEKPDPEGLLKIVERRRPAQVFYVGDVMDDCRAAKAANVQFIGVVGAENPLQGELEAIFRREGAVAVIPNVNELESVLP